MKTIYTDAGMIYQLKESGKKMHKDIWFFTDFGLFNKRITNVNHIALLEQFAIKADDLTEFDGILVVMNLSAMFFANKENYGEHDIDNL